MNRLRRRKVALLAIVMSAWAALKSEASAAPLDAETLLPPQRLFEAIQLLDWSQVEQKTFRNFLESRLRESGLNFAEFSPANPIPADPDVRLVARVDKCMSLEAWLTALGKPTSVDVLLLHSVETATDQNLIQALVTGAEKKFGPVVAVTYPISGQSNYSLTLLGTSDCFDAMRISKNSLK